MSLASPNPDMLNGIPDPCVDPRLLPELFTERDNSRRIRHLKIALRRAMRRLTETQREQIRLHYWEGLRKTEIARRSGVSCSAVTQSIQAGHKTLRAYINLYMRIYDSLEREFLEDDM